MCLNNSSCGCHLNRCRNLGPFTAVDPDCITPPLRRFGYNTPFASGDVFFALLNTTVGAEVNNAALIGFGESITIVAPAVNGDITLTGAGPNYAFPVSQAGSITDITAYFTFQTGITVTPPATALVRAQIYKAPAGSSTFSPTPASVDLVFTGPIAANATIFGSSSPFPPVQVAANERLLMVYRTITAGLPAASIISGTASASITIV